MTVDDVAAVLRVSRQQLLNLRSLDRAPRGFRVGRAVLFRPAEVARWLAEQEAAEADRRGWSATSRRRRAGDGRRARRPSHG